MMRLRTAGATVGALLCLAFVGSAQGAAFDKYGLESVGGSLSDLQAGAHAETVTSFKIKTDSSGSPFAATRDLEVRLPPGLVGNVGKFPLCTMLQFENQGCPIDSQIGIVDVTAFGLGTFTEPLYNMAPGPDVVARLGFYAQLYPNIVNVRVRSESDYGVTASAEGVLSAFPLVEATTTIWAVPADPSHNSQRITPQEALNGEPPPGGGRSSGLIPSPFMANPTRCGAPLDVGFTATSYQLPEAPSSALATLGSLSGCGRLGFAPRVEVTPTTHQAAAPSGLGVRVELPQNESITGYATSHVRHAKLALPEGMTLAAGAAAGQQACSDSEAGYKSRRAAACPDASKLGAAEIDVPALSRPLHGGLYLRTPEPGNLFRVWLIADDLGLHLTLPGELHVDKTTGKVESAFLEMPQAPLRNARIDVFGGPRGPLATPAACGSYLAQWEFTPWSGSAAAGGVSPLSVNEGCDAGGFSPKLSAGSANPNAGAFSRFLTTLIRGSTEQNIASLDVTLPRGLLAKVAGVPLCGDAAAAIGNCPAASRVGSAQIATGPGPSPLWLPQPGKDSIDVYLAGHYRSAPYSLVVDAPAQAGPFDLGTVVSREAIEIDPRTAQATISSDPLPQILEGVPITYRTIHVNVDRPRFALNPTSCEEQEVKAKVTSTQRAVARPSSRFQVAACADLPFRPRLSLKLVGEATRGAFPSLVATLKARSGDANIARSVVSLPESEFLEQGHIRTVCTRVQFARDSCPRGSVYGRAKAWSPLLEAPLQGPVYLRSSKHLLPDLVLALRGKFEIDVVGRIDTDARGGLRATFASVPDAPISKAVVSMQGGRKGLLVNSRNLCRTQSRAEVSFVAHNKKRLAQHPPVANDCAESARDHGQKNH
jgi:hypothetical protein